MLKKSGRHRSALRMSLLRLTDGSLETANTHEVSWISLIGASATAFCFVNDKE